MERAWQAQLRAQARQAWQCVERGHHGSLVACAAALADVVALPVSGREWQWLVRLACSCAGCCISQQALTIALKLQPDACIHDMCD